MKTKFFIITILFVIFQMFLGGKSLQSKTFEKWAYSMRLAQKSTYTSISPKKDIPYNHKYWLIDTIDEEENDDRKKQTESNVIHYQFRKNTAALISRASIRIFDELNPQAFKNSVLNIFYCIWQI